MALGLAGQNVYIDHLEIGDDPGVVEMRGVQVSCPYCHSMGRVPEGVYDYVRQAVRLFRELTPDQARELAETLQRHEVGEAGVAEVEAQTPVAARPLVRDALKREDKRFRIGVLLAILGLLIAAYGIVQSGEDTRAIGGDIHHSQAATAQEFRRLDENQRELCQVIENMMAAADAEMTTLPTPPPRVPARHEPCWCGSGLKFRSCHDSG